MKRLFTIIACSLSLPLFAQHYYEDILGAKEQEMRIRGYADNKVVKVAATGYDARGAKAPDFNELQDFDINEKTLRIATRSGQSVSRLTYQFDADWRLAAVTDSSGDAVSRSVYTYDDAKRLTSIRTTTKDVSGSFSNTEDHRYIYSPGAKGITLYKIMNDKDTTEYWLPQDEKGNVTEEQMLRRKQVVDQVYYYYDDASRLSDLVRYDKRSKQLLPVFMFEFDEQNRVIQKINTISPASREYIILRYIFNEKGLKTKEALFNKQKELTGRIEYAYTFLP